MRLVFMGTPEYAVVSLRSLLAAGYPVLKVVTQPDRPRGRGKKPAPPPVKSFALENGLEVLQPDIIKDTAFIGELRRLAPDIIVVVAFGRILPREILSLPPLGCVNVHASLLPKYRGAAPIHWAVMRGEKETGVTTMYIDGGLDSGDMILQASCPIGEEETVGQVHDRLAEMGGKLLVQTLQKITEGTAPRIPQDDRLATYAPMLKKEDEIIDWNRTAVEIKNHVRGMNPWPGARTTWEGRVLKIWRVEEVKGRFSGRPGTVICAGPKEGIMVQAGSGAVRLLEVQPAGGRPLDATAFLCGHCIKPGTVLGA
ncbi:MAG: methionyl-tRNA formyltransferase [Peptococcaceae bacterium]|nr:methionyl-tRNA formyltransferase [Peptococcaceae bacterium]